MNSHIHRWYAHGARTFALRLNTGPNRLPLELWEMMPDRSELVAAGRNEKFITDALDRQLTEIG